MLAAIKRRALFLSGRRANGVFPERSQDDRGGSPAGCVVRAGRNRRSGSACRRNSRNRHPGSDAVRRHDRRWREQHWRRNLHHYRDDWNPAAYIGLGIVGALVSQGLSENAANSAMDRCASQFRSFEWDTGLYTTYGGEKVLCPYLR